MGRTDRIGTKAADRVVAFVSNLTHAKGSWAGQPFRLREWQEEIVRQLFGTLDADGMRQYRTALLMLPRKNGKTELAAALALYGLLGDGEPGAEVVSAAADRDQAARVFEAAAMMVRNDTELDAACEIVESQKRIVHRASNSIYRALSADVPGKHGLNPSLVIYDELHAAPNRDLWDVLTTSQGTRRQPLILAISTAGYDRKSVLWEIYSYAKSVRDGEINDPTFLPVIYEASEGADWADEVVWHACNPALGDFQSLEEMRVSFKRAQAIPAQQNIFRRLYLDEWTEQSVRAIDMALWDACAAGQPDWQALRDGIRKRPVFGGVDLASTQDIAASVLVLAGEDDTVEIVPHFWIPEGRLASRKEQHRLQSWVRDGLITATPGNVIDYGLIRQHWNSIAKECQIVQIGFDPWNSTQFSLELQEEDGFTMVEVRQGTRTMHEPTKKLLDLVASNKLRHGGHPVLRWMAQNFAVRFDSNENYMPDKVRSAEKIDGLVAAIIGLSRQMVAPVPKPRRRGVAKLWTPSGFVPILPQPSIEESRTT